MSSRLAALVLLVGLAPLAACTWEGRPDGASAVHTDSNGYLGEGFDDGDEAADARLGVDYDAVPADEIVEPLDSETAPVPDGGALTPTTGEGDEVSEVEEALTPGGDQ